jgi:hypothetical protein
VDVAFFEKMSNRWRDEQNRCLREIERHQNADKSYINEGVSRADAQSPNAVRPSGTARKAPPARFLTIELHLGGR